jgi:azurin
MAGGPVRRAAFIAKQGAQSSAVVAEKLAKEAKNPSTTGTESGLDLVVEEVQIKGGNFRLREGASFVIRVKNRGDKALPKGTPLPLTVKIEGMGRRTDLESYTFTDGAAPGETVSVVKNNNGPWTGNLGWTADEAGNYVMEINLDTKAVLGESNRNNNTFRQPIVVSLPADLGSYIVEKSFRGMTSDDSANDIVALLRSIKQGASATWNAKRSADLLADNVSFIKGLGKQLRPQDVEAYERLAGLWKVEIPTAEVKGVVVKRTIMTIKEAMKYSPAEFTVPAGATVELIFENVDAMQHNWVLGALGSQEKIGLAADKMITAADGAAKNYIPAMPEVLAYTPLVESDGRVKVVFKAPIVPGNYPFLCTFPGHWRIMNGVMKVE